MSEQEEAPAKPGYNIPNLFYDVIVFLTPTITFLIGVLTGLHNLWMPYIKRDFKIETGVSAVLVLVLFFASYEFGRLAETFSDIFIASPLRALKKRKLLFTNPDFALDLSPQVHLLGIPDKLYFGRTKSKWSLFFFALQYVPSVGADLLKRYAWEKLARSSAFCGLTLFIISLCVRLVHGIHGSAFAFMEFGSRSFTLCAVALYILSSVDYYKRNCWNNDLLITTMPVILSGVEKATSSQVATVPQAKTSRQQLHPK